MASDNMSLRLPMNRLAQLGAMLGYAVTAVDILVTILMTAPGVLHSARDGRAREVVCGGDN